MRRKLVNEHREQEKTERKREKRERKRETSNARERKEWGRRSLGETFVLEGKDYVCE